MNIYIIGGGPCGLVSGIALKKRHPDYQVTILEKNEDIGSRIKISGNGRCNFANKNISKNKYNHPIFVEKVLGYQDALFSLLDEAGLYYFADDEGRCYPYSQNSQTMIHILKKMLDQYQVKVITSTFIDKIEVINDQIKLSSADQTFIGDKVIAANGGVAYLYDSKDYYSLYENLHLQMIPFESSLTPIKTNNNFKKLEGKRSKAVVKLCYQKQVIKEEYGEVLFKKDGVSGIVIFNMSSCLARLHLSSYQDYSLILDLAPNLSFSQYQELINKDPSLENIFVKEIAQFIKENHLNGKHLCLKVKDLYPLNNAQVSSGGIALSEINDDFSLKKAHNIYVGGETIDIDGECGGYNIEFALLSGLYLGDHI